MPRHIDSGLALPKYYIPYQGFIDAVFGVHINEQHFVIDRAETLDFDFHGAAYLALRFVLSGRLKLYSLNGVQLTEAIFPRARQHHERSARVDQSVAPYGRRWIGDIIYPDR